MEDGCEVSALIGQSDLLDEAVELLKSLEWAGNVCHVCGLTYVHERGHAPDCRLSAFLGRVR